LIQKRTEMKALSSDTPVITRLWQIVISTTAATMQRLNHVLRKRNFPGCI